jgi:hypothetical protein
MSTVRFVAARTVVTKMVPHATLLIMCRRPTVATQSTHRRVTELAASAIR